MPGEKADVLMMAQMAPMTIEGIGKAFTLHKLWEAPDRARLIGELAPRLRAIAAGGPVHDRVDPGFMAKFPKLEIISSFGVGYDHIDAKWAGEHGIVVTNTPDVLNEEVADTALGLLLCTVRELPQAERYLRAGKWANGEYRLTPSLRGRRAGVVGLGRIGKAIARRLEAFGLPVAYHGRNPQAGVPYRYYADLVEMARDVDVMVVITPGGAATRHLINAKVLEALGPSGIFINVSRGSVVDQDALIAALKERRILSAGLDVYANEPNVPPELLAMDNVVLLPHVGSGSVPTRDAMNQLVIDNLLAWAAGRKPLTPVPETPWPPRRRA
ncbi:MAG TPA: 2-hydroxyacid dehydrogenase [Xanthobacteraceae bacterium]|nr:2-hydroxyacid dehydrogenase [Xanthobacteraceae bacterium]